MGRVTEPASRVASAPGVVETASPEGTTAAAGRSGSGTAFSNGASACTKSMQLGKRRSGFLDIARRMAGWSRSASADEFG